MSTQNNNYSVWPAYTSRDQQQHRKFYAMGHIWDLHAEIYKLLPFQVLRTNPATLGDPITHFYLISLETGAETDIVTQMYNDGDMTVQSFAPTGSDAYDLITFPAQNALTDFVMTEGAYEARMTDGTETWYFDVISVHNSISQFVKVKFWHTQPFKIPNHHIDYSDPFYNFFYLDNEINKPNYRLNREVIERGGYEFPIKQESIKEYRFWDCYPEFMTDILRLLPLHDKVVITCSGKTYTVQTIRVEFDEWIDEGHLCPVMIRFFTGEVIVQTTGRLEPEGGGDYDQTDYNNDYLNT